MTMKKKMAAACAAAAMIVTMGAANAQMAPQAGSPSGPPPGYSPPPMGSSMTAPGSAMAPGSSMTTSQTTQSVTSGDAYSADPSAADSTLPKAGGEPLLMMLAGTLIAGSAFALRRKLS